MKFENFESPKGLSVEQYRSAIDDIRAAHRQEFSAEDRLDEKAQANLQKWLHAQKPDLF